eukprot:2853437-Prymnesium_polylepis.1
MAPVELLPHVETSTNSVALLSGVRYAIVVRIALKLPRCAELLVVRNRGDLLDCKASGQVDLRALVRIIKEDVQVLKADREVVLGPRVDRGLHAFDGGDDAAASPWSVRLGGSLIALTPRAKLGADARRCGRPENLPYTCT